MGLIRHKTFLLLASAALLVAGTGFLSRRIPHVGLTADKVSLVATGQTVRPLGDVLRLPGSRPVDIALSPDGKTAYLKDDRGLLRVSTVDWRLLQTLPFPKEGGGSLHGIAVTRDGADVYATGAGSTLWEASVAVDGTLSIARGIPLAVKAENGGGASYPCGIALSPDEQTLYVCLSRGNCLAVVERASGNMTARIPVGVAPYGVALASDGKTAYATNWGGRIPKLNEPAALSAGTPTLIDARGVGASGTVSLVDLATVREVEQVAVGLHPSDLALSPDGTTLYVANANSDTVSRIDTHTRRVTETLTVRPDPALPFGSMPNALALTPDGNTLYVACGGNNAVAQIKTGAASRVLGWLSAGWYPGALALKDDRLYIASIKGLGSVTSKKDNQHGVYDYTGTVQRINVPLEGKALVDSTRQVREDARIPEALRTAERMRSDRKPVPVPERAGEPSVFEHIVYIIKENRTYDQVFGDLKQANGDPALCLFGREVTPNHHALAEEFILLDNFYCNGVLSADGHSWVTEGNVTDHLEKAFGGFTRSYTFGDDPLTYSSSGFLWDNALAYGLSVRNFGEMDYASAMPTGGYAAIWKDWQAKSGGFTFKHSVGVENLRRHTDPEYPGWNLNIADRIRADVFQKALDGYQKRGESLSNLTLVYLPSDHTSGANPGDPTPRAYLADNDLALGQIVDALSHSPWWHKTCIFVIEDDPQAGFDHVDGHRSLCLAISPYTRRGIVLSQFYNQTSVLHTMERMLGLPAMNQMDAAAPLMTACFTGKADLRPYVCKPAGPDLDRINPKKTALSGSARRLAEASERLPIKAHPDTANEDAFNRILWEAVKGPKVAYPTALAGSHGRAKEPDDD